MHSKLATKNIHIDDITQAMQQHPRVVLAVIIIFVMGCISLPLFIIVVPVILLCRLNMQLTTPLAAIGGLLVVFMWVTKGIIPLTLLHHQKLLLHEIMRGGVHFFTFPWVWLIVIPYGLLIGALIGLLIPADTTIRKALKRVSRGEAQKKSTTLNERQMHRAQTKLNAIEICNGALLGADMETGKPIILYDKDANLHTLAIGTTGCGKTTALTNIVKSAIERSIPLVYVDGKGDLELLENIRRLADKHKRSFYAFSMVGESMHYNPIHFGSYTSKKDRIIELRTWSEDHYRKIAEGYLQTVFRILNQYDIHVDLKGLSHYLEPATLYQLAREHEDQDLANIASKLEERAKDVTSLIAEIANIVDSEIGHLFDCAHGKVLQLYDAINNAGVIYFCLTPLAFPAYAETLGKLIINDLKSIIASRLQERVKSKLFTIFDEFSIFAGDQIINLINQGRGAGIHAVLATQSLSDISKKGGDALLGQVLNNTNNYIIMRQNHHNDAEMLANVIGTKEDFQITSQVSAYDAQSSSGSIRKTKSFIIHPDEIKRLMLGEAIWVNKQSFNIQKAKIKCPTVP